MRRLLAAALLFATACAGGAGAQTETQTQTQAQTQAQTVYDVEIVAEYPHDAYAYTQGLFVLDGRFIESTGQHGASSLRRVDIERGDVLELRDMPERYFGEGAAVLNGNIYQLTWRSGVGFIYDQEDIFKTPREFNYEGEGWGLTTDGAKLIMSDGTDELRFLDPETLKETGRVAVQWQGKPVRLLNELEFVGGEVFANIYRSDLIVRIDPANGDVKGVIDARPLRRALGTKAYNAEVLNGIAYDPQTDRLFLTGKYWPKVFEVKLEKRAPASTQ